MKKEHWLSAKQIAEILKISEKKFLNDAGKSGRFKYVQKRRISTERGWQNLYNIESFELSYREALRRAVSAVGEGVSEVLAMSHEVAGVSGVVQVGSELVSQTIELSVPYLVAKLGQLNPDLSTLTDLQMAGYSLALATKTARTHSLLGWIRQQVAQLAEQHVFSFYAILQEALQDDSLRDKFNKISLNQLMAQKQAKPLIKPRNAHNSNAQAKHKEEVKAFLLTLMAQGNRPKLSHCHQCYEQERERRGWGELSLQTLYNYYKEIKASADLCRLGEKAFRLEQGITINRELPQVGEVWSLDGTPANLWVIEEGRIRQSAYRINCVDVGSRFLVSHACKTETAQAYIDCFKAMVRQTKTLPVVVETDMFKGYKQVEAWLSQFGVQLHTYRKGNARARVIEAVNGFLASNIERYQASFTGLNMVSKEGRLSDEYRAGAMSEAMNFRQAVQFIEQDCAKAWNEQTIKTLGKKACNRSPLSIFLAAQGQLKPLEKEVYLQIVGDMHSVKLNNEGLQVSKNKVQYTYFPSLQAIDIQNIAVFFNLNKGKKYKLYIDEYEKEALVFTENDHTRVGFWALKPQVKYNTWMTSKSDSPSAQTLNLFMQVQEQQVSTAKTKVIEAREQITISNEQESSESILKRGEIDKAVLMQVEDAFKQAIVIDAETGEILPPSKDKASKANYYIHPATGKKIFFEQIKP